MWISEEKISPGIKKTIKNNNGVNQATCIKWTNSSKYTNYKEEVKWKNNYRAVSLMNIGT